MPNNDAFSDFSNCYVFKSRLQEYAQKVGLPTPAYETTKEGPSHEPSFRSTVIFNDIRYNSLLGFSNRKAAEQSAAEIALLELSKSGDVSENISQPVHETGLCKNLLQEYAQKMNFAIPLYVCQGEELPGRTLFTCTVEIGGVRYIGGAARIKKEAEIKAARTALLAIQSSASGSSKRLLVGESQLTVLPSKKRGPETLSASTSEDAKTSPKPKKARMKKKTPKRKPPRNSFRHNQVSIPGNSEPRIAEASTFPMEHWSMERMTYPQPGSSGIISCKMENSVDSICHREVNFQNGIAPTTIVGHNQLDNAEDADPKFLKADGSSLLIAQWSMNPTRCPLLGESSVISNGTDSSGEIFYQQGVYTYQSLQSSCNTVIGNCVPPVTGMSSTVWK